MKDADSTSRPARPAAPGPTDSGWVPEVSLERFLLAYDEWKAATVLFEQAVRGMRADESGAREQAQDCARKLASLHHEFLEASQPHFAAAEHGTGSASKTGSGTVPAGGAVAPGDEAPPGTPGTGEAICPRCQGSGLQDRAECPTCLGTGRVNVGVGGA